ncbi:MAG TPA: TonB-dependent receptor [Caldithrix abyssi]|uniref:TonB-dependent receptor n=1 Tax=Caldithrix abyssi TaxID=187145 RepID=A0A7V4U0Y0_CALAY|nr:TonB-dependent receptor [Caldithrix abyssi]
MNKVIFIFTVLSIYLAASHGQDASISGFVIDATNGETLIGANVYLQDSEHGAVSNKSGFYSVTDIPAGEVLLHCNYIGYADFSKKIKLQPGQALVLNIRLKPVVMQSEAIVITADSVSTAVKMFREPISQINISPMEIRHLPAVAEADLMRTLQSLPGILPISDFSSEIYVRGGTSDQNLYLIDGADVYNPEHAFGLFSTFNTDAIKDIEISKGGFGADYGGRLSSVLNVTNLDGNRNSFEGTAEISLLSAKTTLQIPLGQFGSLSTSLRRTYVGETVKLFYDDLPDYYFYDGHIKAFFDINPANKLSVSFYKGNDFLDYAFSQEAEDAPSIHYDWGNLTASMRWTHVFSPHLFSNFWVTASFFNSQFDVTEIGLQEENDLSDISFKGQLEYALSNTLQARFGFEQKNLSTVMQSDSPGGILDLNRKRSYLSAYTALQYRPTSRWLVEGGLRYNHFQADRPFNDWAPRFSLKYRLSKSMNLKASTGIYYQYLHKIPRPFIADIWTTSDQNYDHSRAVHYIIGFQQEVAQNIEFEIETYYKTYSNLYALKNYFLDFEPSSYDATGRPVYTETKGLFDRGDGYSAGLEIMLRKRYGSVTGWLAYSLARTEYTVDGINQEKPFEPRHDRTHVVNAVLNIDVKNLGREIAGRAVSYTDSSRWLAGVNFVYTSGQPITLTSSTYVGNSVPDQDYNQIFLYPTSINNFRLPAYIRLDISLSYEMRFRKWMMTPYLQIINIGNRENVWFIQYKNEEQEDKIIQTVDTFDMFPILPTLGVKFEF